MFAEVRLIYQKSCRFAFVFVGMPLKIELPLTVHFGLCPAACKQPDAEYAG